jgi:hypothetical protein
MSVLAHVFMQWELLTGFKTYLLEYLEDSTILSKHMRWSEYFIRDGYIVVSYRFIQLNFE